jgi:hypothetical protein
VHLVVWFTREIEKELQSLNFNMDIKNSLMMDL